MRRAVAITLLVLYIISSSGVAIKAHYSDGKLQSLHLLLRSNEDKTCKGKCWSEKLAFYKINDCQSATTIITFSPSFDKIVYQVGYIVKSCFEPYQSTCSSPQFC